MPHPIVSDVDDGDDQDVIRINGSMVSLAIACYSVVGDIEYGDGMEGTYQPGAMASVATGIDRVVTGDIGDDRKATVSTKRDGEHTPPTPRRRPPLRPSPPARHGGILLL